MAITIDLLEQVKRHEGFRSRAYKCSAGKTTVGYGRNLDDVGISREEALELLYTDLARSQKAVLSALPWASSLDTVRLDVLINMALNLGIYGLLKFKKTLRAVESSEYSVAAAEMLDSRWAAQVGSRAIELSTQMDTGCYTSPLA